MCNYLWCRGLYVLQNQFGCLARLLYLLLAAWEDRLRGGQASGEQPPARRQLRSQGSRLWRNRHCSSSGPFGISANINCWLAVLGGLICWVLQDKNNGRKSPLSLKQQPPSLPSWADRWLPAWRLQPSPPLPSGDTVLPVSRQDVGLCGLLALTGRASLVLDLLDG